MILLVFRISKEVCIWALCFEAHCVELCSSPKRRGLLNTYRLLSSSSS